jgi:hypothetical protein
MTIMIMNTRMITSMPLVFATGWRTCSRRTRMGTTQPRWMQP